MGGNAPLFSKLSDALASFTGGSGSAIGLSIGSSSIKLVELQKVKKTWKLQHFAMVPLPDDALSNREIINHISVVESIKALIDPSKMKLKSKQVCSAMAGTSLIIKRMMVEVPKISELQDSIFWEAEQYLPFDAQEVVMDFQVLSRGKDNKTDVILVAVKKSVLDTYMNCILDAGLKPKIMDTEFFALQNVFEANYPMDPSKAVAIVDIGATSIKIVVVHGGVPVYTKDTSLGGRNLTAEIEKHLNLSFVDAESLKVSGHATGMPQEVSDLMGVMADNFAVEIRRALDFYNASSSGAPVEFILLGGGSSKIPELSRLVEDKVGLPTQILNPFNAISYDPAVFSPEYIAEIGPLAAVPIGLALRAGAR
ncbi:MAG: type IV pilus assembly protein PilM [Methylotenera sp.]|nr:type IV pilus assembly protein PilM [Oligoflexia bacterium]